MKWLKRIDRQTFLTVFTPLLISLLASLVAAWVTRGSEYFVFIIGTFFILTIFGLAISYQAGRLSERVESSLDKRLPEIKFIIGDENELRYEILTTVSRAKSFVATTGGRALKFYSSLRVDIRRIATLKEGDKVIGNRVKVKIVKNKLAPPFREAQFDLIYGKGISKEGDLIDCGVDEGFIEKTGTWYSYKGERLGQGKESVKKLLQEKPEIADQLDTEIRIKVGLIPGEPAEEQE